MQTRRDLIKLKAIRRTHGLDVVSQQTQFAAQRRLNPSNVAERRRQVVDIDRSQRAVAVVLRTQGPAATLLFEPHDGGTQDATVTQVIAHPRLHDTQVLTDNDGTRALGLQEDDAHHGLMVVVHVSTFGRYTALWDPPQAEHSQDVVDTHGTGISQGGAHHVAQRRVARLSQRTRRPRRLRPVLALLRVHVRRGTHAHARGEQFGTAPLLGPMAVNTHSQVSHNADLHTDLAGHVLRVGQLLGRNPLAPLPEINAVGQLKALEFNARRRGTLKVLGQLQRVLTLNERTPQRIVRQLGAAVFHEVVELRLAVVGTRRGENNFQRLALGFPGAVAVDQILTTGELSSDITQLLNGLTRSLGQRGKFFDGLRADVNRVHPAARHRQVRGGFQRRNRLGRVDWINEKEVRPLVRAHRRQVGQVSRVADPPGRG